MALAFKSSLLVERGDYTSQSPVEVIGSGSGYSERNHSSYHHYPTAREYEPAGLTFLMMTSAVTWIMLPGVGFFYSGMARSKSALSLLMLCLWSCAVVSIQWYLVGFTLCLSNTGGPFIGNLDHLLMREIGDRPSWTHDQVPLLLASVWYCLFATITPTVFLGAIAERARFLPTVIFIFLWTTLVFDFLTYWTWNKNGWSFQLGSLDFGGGTPVHISSGAAALAFAYMVGKREDTEERKPPNMANVYLGTSFIWCGWLVANAGSGLYPHIRAVAVFVTTNLAASAGGITWSIIDYIRQDRKWSALGFCCGSIAGLVCITPASGYVTPSSSLFFGFAGALCCNFAMSSKRILHVDDAFDVFACHGVGGIVGNILTGVFAQRSVAAVDGQHIKGGWLDGHWIQIGYQTIDSAAGFAWSFICTLIILFFINACPGLHLRAPPEDQEIGMDSVDLGMGIHEYFDEFKNENGFGPRVPTTASTLAVHQQQPNIITISSKINGDVNGYGVHSGMGIHSASGPAFHQQNPFITKSTGNSSSSGGGGGGTFGGFNNANGIMANNNGGYINNNFIPDGMNMINTTGNGISGGGGVGYQETEIIQVETSQHI